MDWRLLGVSFLTVFLAEIGDKSQVAAIALSGSSAHPRNVFAGNVVALILASFLGILTGEGVAQVFPMRIVKASQTRWSKMVSSIMEIRITRVR